MARIEFDEVNIGDQVVVPVWCVATVTAKGITYVIVEPDAGSLDAEEIISFESFPAELIHKEKID